MARTTTRARTTAFVDEVFLSVQGEGIWVGERQVFVRFSGCALDCAYCDSQRARRLTDRLLLKSEDVEGHYVDNPVAQTDLTHIVANLAPASAIHSVAVTGGEPLLQDAFLATWLPDLRGMGYRVYLETAGTLPERLARVIHAVDFCSMDIKLPSATGLRAYWQEHRAFLICCREAGVPTMAKAVVSSTTTSEEVRETARMIAETWDAVTLVLQPVTPMHRVASRPDPKAVLALQAEGLRWLRSVRVIPQTHRLVGMP